MIVIEMEELPGMRAGSRRYHHRGYLYHLDSRNALFDMYRCAARTTLHCRGMVRIEGAIVQIITPHELHDPNPFTMQEVRMKEELLALSRGSFLPLLDLYREVSGRYDKHSYSFVGLRM